MIEFKTKSYGVGELAIYFYHEENNVEMKKLIGTDIVYSSWTK